MSICPKCGKEHIISDERLKELEMITAEMNKLFNTHKLTPKEGIYLLESMLVYAYTAVADTPPTKH